MALWLHEHDGPRFDWPVGVSAMNAAMCLATVVLIVWHWI